MPEAYIVEALRTPRGALPAGLPARVPGATVNRPRVGVGQGLANVVEAVASPRR